MPERIDIGQNEATVLYPAVTLEELNNDSVLLYNYRRTMGRERMLWGALGVTILAWGVDYIRRGK